MKKRTIAIAMAVLMTAALLSGCGSKTAGEVTVQAVTSVAEISGMGAANRYGGVVISQNEVKVSKDAERTVKEIYVTEGQEVKKGDKLFSYDVDEIEISIEKMELEKEQLENNIAISKEQIAQLEKEKSYASSSDQASYTVEITDLQIGISEDEYNLKSKEKEIERTKAVLNDTDVKASVNGIVSKIENDSQSAGDTYYPEEYYGGDETGAFITITETGDYKVKGTINELNNGEIMEGSRMIVRSRIDEAKLWYGTVEKIDWDTQQTSENMYEYGGDTENTSSNYPFYIVLDDTEGLFMGQHVYLEPDMGQSEAREGMWLTSAFICDVEGDPYVWAANQNDKIEKYSVELGAYDAELDMYEIVSGLAITDYIAFPDETITEGMNAVRYSETAEVYDDDYAGAEVAAAVEVG